MLDILAKRPISAEGWFNMGLAQLQQGDHDGARSCFALAAAADPSLVPALFSATALLRQDYSPNDEGSAVMLPPWAVTTLSCAGKMPETSAERALNGVLACLNCQRGRLAEADLAVNEEEMTKGLLFALRSFMEQRGPLDLGALSKGLGDVAGEALDTLRAFKRTVAEHGFGVAFQPIVHIGTGDIHHFEALCRFGDDGDSPFKVITFAEQAGLIHEFDLAMAELVIKRMHMAQRGGEDVKVAINVSGYSLGISAYLDGLLALLARNSWTKGRLIFEITESARMADLESANDFIQALHKLGHEVCLDDFGAGAASFQYLSMLDVDAVKIDGSAIANARRTGKARALLSALAELCRRIGVATVAEMVEDAACLAFCRACGCDYAQGYLFGRPAPDFAAFRPLPNRDGFE